MSLLTSPYTTRQQLDFFNKLEKGYFKSQKKFSHLRAQAIQKISQQNKKIQIKIPEDLSYKFEVLITNFLKQLQKIIKDNSVIDYYFCLSEMRRNNFFSDVANYFNAGLAQKYQKLEEILEKKDEQAYFLTRKIQSLKQISQRKSTPLKINGQNSHRRIPTSGLSIAHTVYYRAKSMSQDEFKNYFDNVILQQKIVLKKINALDQKKTDAYRIQLLERIQSYLSNINNIPQQQSEIISNDVKSKIQNLIKQVKQTNLKMQSQCRKPCCLAQNQEVDSRPNKAKSLMRSAENRNEAHIYKNNKTQEYFKRYYRGKSFDIKGVISVQKTKLEQMQKIQQQHRKNLLKRQKALRYGKTATNFRGAIF